MGSFEQYGVKRPPSAEPAVLRVLVIEDETLLSLALETMLEEWGYDQVGSAATGADAIRLARETNPDVVLMDVNLAGDIDGVDAAARIRGFSEARIVFMTAYSDSDLAARPGMASAIVLHKPFSPRRLHAVLAAIAEGDGSVGFGRARRDEGAGPEH